MGRSLRWGVGAAAAVTVAVLTLGGSGGAWASAPSTTPPPWVPPSWCTSSVSGTVTAVGTGSFTLTESDGRVVTVTTTASTTYAETGAVVPPTGVAAGEQVTVTTVPGTARTATSVTATRVLVVLTHVLGTVGSVGAGSFDVQLVGGLVVTVDTGPGTVVRKAGVVQSGVSVGEYVTAYGAADPSDPSRLDAQFVVISTPPTADPTPTAGGHTGGSHLLSGIVSAAAAEGFTLTVADGTVVDVTTTPTTTYGETGSQTAPSGVSDGEQVRVRPVDGTSYPATSVTADRVVVVLTQVTGVVRSIGTGTFAVQLFGGLVLTVETTGATVYAVNGVPAAGVVVGEKVTAYGAPDPSAPAQLIAQFVDLHPQPTSGGHHGWPGSDGSSGRTDTDSDGDADGDGHHPTATPSGTDPVHAAVWGTVRSVTGDDITVVEPSGAPVTVVVSSSTRYEGRSGAGGLAAVTTGTVVGVAGTSAGASQIDALVVVIGGDPTTGDRGGRSGDGTPGDGSTTSTTATTVPSGTSHSGTSHGGTTGGSWGAGQPTSASTTTTDGTSSTPTSTATTAPSTGSGDTTWAHQGSGTGAGSGGGQSSGDSGQRGTGSPGRRG